MRAFLSLRGLLAARLLAAALLATAPIDAVLAADDLGLLVRSRHGTEAGPALYRELGNAHEPRESTART
jgi:hypothetical protein